MTEEELKEIKDELNNIKETIQKYKSSYVINEQ